MVKNCRVQDLEKRLQEQKEKEERAEQEMLEVWIWVENGEREQTAETKVLKLETKYERTRLPRFSHSKKKKKDVVKLVSHWRVLKVEGRWF